MEVVEEREKVEGDVVMELVEESCFIFCLEEDGGVGGGDVSMYGELVT